MPCRSSCAGSTCSLGEMQLQHELCGPSTSALWRRPWPTGPPCTPSTPGCGCTGPGSCMAGKLASRWAMPADPDPMHSCVHVTGWGRCLQGLLGSCAGAGAEACTSRSCVSWWLPTAGPSQWAGGSWGRSCQARERLTALHLEFGPSSRHQEDTCHAGASRRGRSGAGQTGLGRSRHSGPPSWQLPSGCCSDPLHATSMPGSSTLRCDLACLPC